MPLGAKVALLSIDHLYGILYNLRTMFMTVDVVECGVPVQQHEHENHLKVINVFFKSI